MPLEDHGPIDPGNREIGRTHAFAKCEQVVRLLGP
jgi:hypothetical protein